MKTTNKKFLAVVIITSFLSMSSNAHAFDFNSFVNSAKEKAAKALVVASALAAEGVSRISTEISEASRRNYEANNDASNESAKNVEVSIPTTDDSVIELSGNVPQDSKWVMVNFEKDGFKENITFAVKNGEFKKNFSLKDGSGIYQVSVFANTNEDRYTQYTYVEKYNVSNIDTRDMNYLLPSDMVQSNDEKIVELAEDITKGSINKADALLKINNYIIKTIKYDYDSFYSGAYINLPYDALTVLESGSAFCSGYANYLAALARAAGIRTKVINGKVNMPDGSISEHAWNEVYIDGEWKVIDVTWNTGADSKKYFLPTPEAFALDHIKDDEQTEKVKNF